jgi:two-component system chemotaxis sensor kinase CheA
MTNKIGQDNEQLVPNGFDKEMSEILETFIVESNEILETMGRDLLEFERRPLDMDLLNSIFRASHTLKGTSSFLGFTQMADLTHLMEDLLNKLRKAEMQANDDIVDALFEAFDTVKALLLRIESRNTQPVDLSTVLERLDGCIRGMTNRGADPSEPAVQRSDTTEMTQNAAGFTQQKLADSTIRVEVSRLDELMNLVGELVLARNRLIQHTQILAQDRSGVLFSKEIQESGIAVDFITTELQRAVMKTRMVPVAKVFNKLPRLVRELSKETHKDVELQVYGKETELDKSIIDALNDPLLHIIRNAIDHGIEAAEERAKERKPVRGTIVVNAEHEGNHIVLSIEDDGKGMDSEELKQKAVEKGLLTEAEARELSKRDALNLIFAPGFSTAKTVTSISGRGVGMDIVRANVAKLKGIIEIDSEPGRGTIFTLKLPLTLAIIQGLIVNSGGELFAIPLGSVLEVVRVSADEIETINGGEVIRLRDSVLPLGRIATTLNLKGTSGSSGWMYIVVVGWSDQRLGIIVDSLQGQREIVIKPLGDYLENTPAIAGSTILGDGKIVLIIDIGKFMRLCRQQPSEQAAVKIGNKGVQEVA